MKPLIAEYGKLIKTLKKKAKRASGKKPEGAAGIHQSSGLQDRSSPSAERQQESITLFFRNASDIIDSYSAASPSGSSVVNPEIVEYLESRVSAIQLKRKVTIEIEYGGEPPGDPFLPEKLIKKNLEASIIVSLRRNSKIMFSSFALALAGIAILFFLNQIPYFTDHYAFHELFVVISWVFIWRFVELFFFERTKLRFRRMKLLQIYLAEYRLKSPDH